MITYWEDDDTGAEEDANRLESTLQNLFGLTPLMFKISKNTRNPSWDVKFAVISNLQKGHGPTKLSQTLFIFAYIGHGTIDFAGGGSELIFGDKTQRNVRWQMIPELVNDQDIDFLGILDCCHAELKATRDQIPQTVEVLAACGPEETARSRQSRVTFTQRLCGELQRVEQYSKTAITAELLFERLRNSSPAELSNPRLLHYGGIRPILLTQLAARIP